MSSETSSTKDFRMTTERDNNLSKIIRSKLKRCALADGTNVYRLSLYIVKFFKEKSYLNMYRDLAPFFQNSRDAKEMTSWLSILLNISEPLPKSKITLDESLKAPQEKDPHCNGDSKHDPSITVEELDKEMKDYWNANPNK